MKQKRRSPIVEEFPELDQLVLKEIEAMVEHSYAEVSPRAQDAAPARAAAESRRPEQKKVQQHPARARHARQTQAREEFTDWDNELLEPESIDQEMLSGEERRFVDDTVAWLRGRPNPDILIASIWSRVVDSDAKSFRPPAAPPAQGDLENEDLESAIPNTGEENPDPLP